MRQYKGDTTSWYATQDRFYEIFRYRLLPNNGLRVDYYNISAPTRQCFRIITDPDELATIRHTIGFLLALRHPVYSRDGRTIIYFENPFVDQPQPPQRRQQQKNTKKQQRRRSFSRPKKR